MRVALRNAARVGTTGESVLTMGDLRVDLGARRCWRGELEVRLTRTEFNLLAALARHAGKVLTHRQLLREVWGPSVTEAHYVRVYMGQLRHKLESDPAQPRYLLTETGVGYRLQAE
jgi:two-component system KDP operon response regulator KdpE